MTGKACTIHRGIREHVPLRKFLISRLILVHSESVSTAFNCETTETDIATNNMQIKIVGACIQVSDKGTAP